MKLLHTALLSTVACISLATQPHITINEEMRSRIETENGINTNGVRLIIEKESGEKAVIELAQSTDATTKEEILAKVEKLMDAVVELAGEKLHITIEIA